MTAPSLRPLAEVMRDEMVMKDRILAQLREGPKTIPELAEALGFPPREVTLWVMAMRRYGAIEELSKPRADDYFRYGVAR